VTVCDGGVVGGGRGGRVRGPSRWFGSNRLVRMTTATVINPSAFPVTFPASQDWHKDGRDVTIYAVQLFSAYHLLDLAVKGMTFRPVSSPVRFLNRTFDRKFSAARWQALLAPVVAEVRESIAFCSADPRNCLTADAD
jgi:hypothetical protein